MRLSPPISLGLARRILMLGLVFSSMAPKSFAAEPINGLQAGVCAGQGKWCDGFGGQVAYNWKWVGIETYVSHNQSLGSGWRFNPYNQNTRFRPFLSMTVALTPLDDSWVHQVLGVGVDSHLGNNGQLLVQARATLARPMSFPSEESASSLQFGGAVSLAYAKGRQDRVGHPAGVGSTPFFTSRAGICVGLDPSCIGGGLRLEFSGRYLGVAFSGLGLSGGLTGKLYPYPLMERERVHWRPYIFGGFSADLFAGRVNGTGGAGLGADVHTGSAKRLVLQPQISFMSSSREGAVTCLPNSDGSEECLEDGISSPIGGSLGVLWAF